jgi:hypothetical protein
MENPDNEITPRQQAEHDRLHAEADPKAIWRRWGTYLPERQWGTVREDYSHDGNCWSYLTHDHARSRAYRWGEDGLLGYTDRECRLCFGIALWNEKDGILKERLFGLTNDEGNHGEDVKEEYFYLRGTPTHSYSSALYKYPQTEYPYEKIVAEAHSRTPDEPEFELVDTGIFKENRYFDIGIEYAKASPEDTLIRVRATNRADKSAPLHILPQFWFRNTWSWGEMFEGCKVKPRIHQTGDHSLELEHETLGHYRVDVRNQEEFRGFLFTENDTNYARHFSEEVLIVPDHQIRGAKDAFHEYVINDTKGVCNKETQGTKSAGHFVFEIPAQTTVEIQLRLTALGEVSDDRFGDFDHIMEQRIHECDAFYHSILPPNLDAEQRNVCLQAYGSLLWTKQFYHYVVEEWQNKSKPEAKVTLDKPRIDRNKDWKHVHSRDVISMPDKWEYPWFAAWDLAFQMIPFVRIDPHFAKDQISLFLREWYMHPNGQMPAYEFAFGDVNPPVHAWAAWRVYKIEKGQGRRDFAFLARAFQKLLINFTWWVNRTDEEGNSIFAGGFLGLDNISIFDRTNHKLPEGMQLQQADGTGWMAFYCISMLRIALELSKTSKHSSVAYGDMASKFFEHFVQIVEAINSHGGQGLWDEFDGFYYDQILHEEKVIPIKTRSLVGLIPIAGVFFIDEETLQAVPGFAKRFNWFLKNRTGLSRHIIPDNKEHPKRWLLSTIPPKRLTRVLERVFSEDEFFSDHGIRSLSKYHAEHPFTLELNGVEHQLEYIPGVSNAYLFGGNSNWRGPVWFPLNHLIIAALDSYHEFFGDRFQVNVPGLGYVTLDEAAREVRRRLVSLFMPVEGKRPAHGEDERFSDDPAWKDLVLFHEYFHGDTGVGLGAAHQTGWTALVATHFEKL